MTARAQILAKLKAASPSERAEAGAYHPQARNDLKTEFAAKAEAADALVHEIAGAEDLPAKLQSLFSVNGETTPLHVAPGSFLRELPWGRAPNLTLHDTPPASEALALSAADFAIAETGTLAFLSGGCRWWIIPTLP